jgi:lysophospholipase L1-like esterase
MTRRFAAFCAVALLGGCKSGGGPGGPTPTPTPAPYNLTATVFYDENQNGRLDAGENARLPGVELIFGDVAARSAAGGVVTAGVSSTGPRLVAVRNETLPQFFVGGASQTVDVPQAVPLFFPVTLPIGDNLPNTYLGFGDSITTGLGSSDGQGYVKKLEGLLAAHYGVATVTQLGKDGDFSKDGADRIPGRLFRARAAYTLIHYGTNDYNDQGCQSAGPANCFTVDSFLTMLEECRRFRTLPVVGTIIPANPAIAPGRNNWIDQANVLLKQVAQQQGALVADLNAEFKSRSNVAALFSDEVHPNDAGYQVMAEGWFKALTRGRAAATAGRGGVADAH